MWLIYRAGEANLYGMAQKNGALILQNVLLIRSNKFLTTIVENIFYKTTCEEKKPLYICTRFWNNGIL